MLRVLLVLCLWVVIAQDAKAQTEQELLKNIDTASILTKAKIYSELADLVVYERVDLSFDYAQQSLEWAKQSQNEYQIAYAYSCLAYAMFYKGDYAKAAKYLEKDYPIYKTIKDTSGMIFSLSHQGDAISYLGNHKKAIPLLEEALKLALVTDNQGFISDVYNRLGMIYDEMGDYQKAISIVSKALHLDTTHQNRYSESSSLNNLACVYNHQGQYPLALEYFKRSIEIADFSTDDYHYGIGMTNLGSVYHSMGMYDSALVCAFRYLEISRNVENDFDVGLAYNQVADIQLDLGNFAAALENINKAISGFEALRLLSSEARAYLTLGKIYLKQNNHELAIQTLNNGLKMAKKQDDKKLIGALYNLSGEIYNDQKQYTKALQLHKKALALFNAIGSKSEMVNTYFQIAKNEARLGNHADAIYNANRCLKLSIQINYRLHLDKIYGLLSNNYAQLGDYKAAFEYHVQYKLIQDSLYNMRRSTKIAELETAFYVKEKEAENLELKSEKIQNRLVIQQRTIILTLLGLLALAIALYSVWQASRRKQQYNEQLESEVLRRTKQLKNANVRLLDTNKQLENFASIASHDLKSPLRTVASFVSLIKRRLKPHITDETQEYFDLVNTNIHQMNTMIANVLEFSRSSDKALAYETIDAKELAKNLIKSISSYVTDKNATIEIDDLPTIQADKVKLYVVFKNLIENGMKYNQNDIPTIHISSKKDKDGFVFSVQDNGIGISEEYQQSIFDMFKRLHSRQEYEGTGIGLAYCKKIIEQHQGKIWVESQKGQGSTFFFTIPTRLSN